MFWTFSDVYYGFKAKMCFIHRSPAYAKQLEGNHLAYAEAYAEHVSHTR